MKKYIVILNAVMLLFACNTSKTKEQIDANNALIEKIKKDEPKVADAIITDADVLYISTKSDGTNRNGYAEYFCTMKNDIPNNTVNHVKVVEVGTANSANKETAYGVLLGECYCK